MSVVTTCGPLGRSRVLGLLPPLIRALRLHRARSRLRDGRRGHRLLAREEQLGRGLGRAGLHPDGAGGQPLLHTLVWLISNSIA